MGPTSRALPGPREVTIRLKLLALVGLLLAVLGPWPSKAKGPGPRTLGLRSSTYLPPEGQINY